MKLNHEKQIIGGMFGFPERVSEKFNIDLERWCFLKESNLFLINARSGIKILIDLLKPTNIWMPSYLCPTMIHAVDENITKLKFYEVDYNLQIADKSWTKKIKPNDIVVFIDYFGFPFDLNVATQVKKHGGWIIEDACQALLSKHVGQNSDFVLFSPRKFIGIPDGGILVSRCDIKFDNVDLEPAPTSWRFKMLEAAIDRREFDHYGGKRNWYKLFRKADIEVPCGYYTMSELSRELLFNSFNYSEISKRRIENYLFLLQELKNIALFPELPKGIVPLGFPIRHVDRDQIRESLFKEQIYPPIHWALNHAIPEYFNKSHNLANHIMTLPSDQRYNHEDMCRIVNIVQKELEC